MPKPSDDTRDALNALQNAKTQRAKCDALHLAHSWRGTIGRIQHGENVSLEAENVVRHRLGLAPILPPLYQLPPCPDCGNPPHTGRCNGKQVAAVVTLSPGETIKRNGKPRNRKAYWRPCLPVELQPALADWNMDAVDVLTVAVELRRRNEWPY